MGVRDRAMSLAQRLSQTKFDRGDERGHGAQDHSDRVAWSPFCWGVGTYPAEASHGVPPPFFAMLWSSAVSSGKMGHRVLVWIV